MHLPAYDERQLDMRFLTEAARLLEEGAVHSYRELAEKLQQQPVIFRQVEIGRYHCSVKMLYQLRAHFPTADVDWVLYGQAYTGRPEPTQAPKRERGRPVRTH
ncbi:hypothetical protein [Hymenobacter metallilatus]|uniref:XRE family transcriptional regulator n=1 Tax=Hymenobacter metallilatus TaxID=2493666 RepID=A0A428JD54_9BACT|nr:hypothetical protein [Hymenobacter metallilatus]RSK29886.1 hypothetical protein EI290_16255 [Hymenobacter metallilatus]